MVRWFVVALALVVGLAASAAAASPLWGSDLIRQARPTAEVDVLIFDLRRETTRPGKPSEIEEQVVTLAPTFTDVRHGGQRLLEDHALCKSLSWAEGVTTFENSSCYAAVAFRLAELQNRNGLARMMTEVSEGKIDKAQQLHWSEAELGVARSDSKRLDVRRTDGATEYRLGRTVMARVSGSAGDLSPDEKQRVIRFLARYANVHPQVRGDLAKSGPLPSLIERDTGEALKVGQGRQVMKISNLRRTRAAYPLPPGMTSALAEEARAGTTVRGRAVRRAMDVIAGKAPSPSLSATLAAMRKSVADGRQLEAMLLFTQLTQEHRAVFAQKDSQALNEVRELLPIMRQDPDAERFMNASLLAGDDQKPGDRQAAAKFLAGPKFSGLAYGTFRNVTYANLVAGADTESWDPAIAKQMPAERVDNYWIHIEAYPWSSNTWKDAGDGYYTQYETGEAWKAFDLGRELDPTWQDGPMKSIGEFEKTMRAQEPDFF